MTDPIRRAISAPLATVIAAFCGVLGAVAGSFVTGYYNQESQITVEQTRVGGALDLERLKFQASLILKAIDTEDQQTAVKTLKFFANAGLIPAYEGKVRTLTEADRGSAVPALRPSPSAYRPLAEVASTSDAARVGRAVGLFTVGGKGVCTAFLMKTDRVVVPKFCLPDGRNLKEIGFRLGFDSKNAAVKDLDVQGIEQADVAGLTVLRVDPGTVGALSTLSLSLRKPVPGEAVYIVHHPRGGTKQLSADCFVHAERPIAVVPAAGLGPSRRPVLQFTCRSEGGSAGAPVIAVRDGVVLGVHFAGRMGGFELYAIPASEFLSASANLP